MLTRAGGSQPPVPWSFQQSAAFLWRQKWEISIITTLFAVLGFALSDQQQRVYESQAAVLVRPVVGSSDRVIAQANMATETRLVSSVVVAERVVEKLQLKRGPQQLLEHLKVDNPQNTEVLLIRYEDTTPARAQIRAQAFAEAYLEFRRADLFARQQAQARALEAEVNLLTTRLDEVNSRLAAAKAEDKTALQSQATSVLTLIVGRQLALIPLQDPPDIGVIVEPARLPESPSRPNKPLNAGLGGAAGLMAAILTTVLAQKLDRRPRTVDDFQSLIKAPVLGRIPELPRRLIRGATNPIPRLHTESQVAEAYRILRANLTQIATTSKVRTLLVTSAYKSEEASATVANLAWVLARAGRHVIAVSGDMRERGLHRWFGLDDGPGFAEALMGIEDVDSVLVSTPQPHLRILRGGMESRNPPELLAAHSLKDVLKRLEDEADYVLIDSPPLLRVSDAVETAASVDGVILVIDPTSADIASLNMSRQRLENAGAQMLGAVLTHIKLQMTDANAIIFKERRSPVRDILRHRGKKSSQAEAEYAPIGGVGRRISTVPSERAQKLPNPNDEVVHPKHVKQSETEDFGGPTATGVADRKELSELIESVISDNEERREFLRWLEEPSKSGDSEEPAGSKGD